MSDLGLRMDSDPRSRRRGKDNNRRKRGRRNQRKGRSALAVFVAFLVVIGLLATGGWYVYGFLQDRFGPPPDYKGGGNQQTVVVTVGEGMYGPAIGNALKKSGVIKSVDAFTKAVREDPEQRGSRIQPGAYLMHKHMSARAALELMADPKSRSQVIVPEGARSYTVYKQLADKLRVDPSVIEQAAKDPSIQLPDWAAKAKGNLEGFLYPLPYPAAPGMDPVAIIRQMVKTSTEKYNAPGGLVEKAKAAGKNPYDVLITASLVEAEAQHSDDRPKVAEVVWNRLKSNTKLAFDSTINYYLRKSTTNLTEQELNQDEPYNTRLHTGLPPTPINNPGQDAIDAALNPSTKGYLYFVTVNPANGATKFTSSYSEFQEFEKEFRDWLKQNPGQG